MARSSGNVCVSVRTGTRGASARNSSPSRRVRFATEQIVRSCQRSSIGERRNVAHVNPAADDRAAALEHAQRCRDERTDRREDDRGIELFRRHFVRASCPDGAEPAREFLRRRVAWSGKRKKFPALMPRHLRNDVGRGAEAIDSQRAAHRPFCADIDSRSIRRKAAVRRWHRHTLP